MLRHDREEMCRSTIKPAGRKPTKIMSQKSVTQDQKDARKRALYNLATIGLAALALLMSVITFSLFAMTVTVGHNEMTPIAILLAVIAQILFITLIIATRERIIHNPLKERS